LIRETFTVGLLGCNCTILGDETSREAIVVDPGDDIPRILALLAKHQLTVRQIIITHAHIDHIGGAYQLKQVTAAPVLYHHLDLPLVTAMSAQAAWLRVKTPEVKPPDDTIKDGSSVRVAGIEGTIMHTPGHTWGSVCVYIPAESLLLAGDTLFAGSIGRTDLPGGDSVKLMRSISRHLMPLPPPTLVVPGHGKTTTIGWEREHNPLLAGL
jgi:hydroxyacylglutathione hydrolase